ncbi:MAG TPA: FKBP-type peptidyl-prolyl cis-trans isomerase [Vicinamibacterales bacterium]|nr:FKBP-type peptidyl-prolyl cis-trans isomerase [Vicinamibacterales bacterium]
MRRRLPVLLLLAALVATCTLKDDDPYKAPPDVAAPPADALRTPSGLASKVLSIGVGTVHPGLQSSVTVNYTGWTADGQMFDTTVLRSGPATFKLTEVIPGWTEVLQLMTKGEKRRVWVPANLAYGDHPAGGQPAGMLCFEIELLEVR